MKRILILLALAVLSCKNEKKTTEVTVAPETVEKELAYASFGDEISDEGVLSTSELMVKFDAMKEGDTIQVKTSGTIVDVCSKKGCWMKLDMGNDKTVRVTFKDYGFFVPLNASGEAIINGQAYVTETSVDELKHYAEDAGKSQEEIDAITEPEFSYAFIADGVLLKE